MAPKRADPFSITAVKWFLILGFGAAIISRLLDLGGIAIDFAIGIWPVLAVAAISVVALVSYALWRASERIRILGEGQHHLADFLELSPTDFELAVRDVLLETGYRSLDHSGGAGDLAADLAGTDSRGRSVVVQCKRFRPGSSVGSKDMQMFIGMVTIHHRAEHGVFVTTSTFTSAARELVEVGQTRGHRTRRPMDFFHAIGAPELAVVVEDAVVDRRRASAGQAQFHGRPLWVSCRIAMPEQ